MTAITSLVVTLALAMALVTTVEAGTFRIDLSDNLGSAAGWDVFTGSVGDTSITDQDGVDNDVTLSIGTIGGEGNAGAPGTGATIDTVTVPKEARDDYFYGPAPYTGTTILFEFKNLDAGTYKVSVFQGRSTSQFGKIWAGVVGDEPAAQNTGNFSGGDSTVEVTISAGESVFYLHIEDNAGGTSGIIVRSAGPAVALSANTVVANAPPGTLVGTLDFSPDGPSETFSFVAGVGDTDNGKFDIVNTNELRTNQYLPSATYDIRVEGDDGAATTVANSFTITSSAATYSAFVASAGVNPGTPAGGEVVATLAALDSDGTSITAFGIVGGRDDLFQISGNELQQKAGADPGAPATTHYLTLFADGAVDDFVIVEIVVGTPAGTVIRIR